MDVGSGRSGIHLLPIEESPALAGLFLLLDFGPDGYITQPEVIRVLPASEVLRLWGQFAALKLPEPGP